MIFISLVPYQEIPKVWPKIRSFVVDVEEMSEGRTSVTDIYNDLIEGRMLLWVAFDHEIESNKTKFMAFCCTTIKEYPNKRMLFVDFMGGEEMSLWLPQMNETISSFGASQECEGLECVGRRGWEKALKNVGWHPKYVIMEKLFTVPDQLANKTLN